MPARRRNNRKAGRKARQPRPQAVMIGSPVKTGPAFKGQRSFQVATSTATGGSDFVTLLDLGPNTWPATFKTFLSYYDYLRVNFVKVILTPFWNMNPTVDSTFGLPLICFSTEYDSTTVLTTFDQIQGRAGARTSRFDRSRSFGISPCVLNSIQLAGSGTAQVSIGFKPWINLQGGNPLMLGIRYALNTSLMQAGAAYEWHVQYTVHFEARQAIM